MKGITGGRSYPVPKPKPVKKKRLYNGYKHKAERTCYYCGTRSAERHEVYGGPNRQISIAMGFQIDLCPDCHRAWHAQAEEKWIRRKEQWQEWYQREHEKKLIRDGMSPEQARRHWMAMIGKNYREELSTGG